LNLYKLTLLKKPFKLSSTFWPCIFAFISVNLTAQNVRDSIIFTPIMKVNYAVQVPGGDLATRYGWNNSIGCAFGYKSVSNSTIELTANFIHGNQVKESQVINALQNQQGWIINQYGEESRILLYERGFNLGINVGKIIPLIGPNKNSGIHLKIGSGWLYHKIRIENENNLIPQLSKENLVYYDRMSMGGYISQYIGYQHMSNDHLVNFSFGFEFLQGFTKGMRDYQIDLMGPYKDNNIDFLSTIRIGWIFPIFRQSPNDFYYN